MATPLDLFFAWQRLGIEWMSLMAGSGAVIARRTGRRPTARRLHAMASEKVLAATVASQAMARAMPPTIPATLPAMGLAWARILAAGMAPYSARVRANSRRR